jgi:hypothetical protein
MLGDAKTANIDSSRARMYSAVQLFSIFKNGDFRGIKDLTGQ